jgi:uncharacterized membrane-anchored protein
MHVYVAALILSLVWIATARALDPEPESHGDPASDWVLTFDWQTEPRIYSVAGANANFRLGEDEVALFGAEAGRFAVELEGAESFRDIDAVILKAEGPLADSMIVMAHVPMGFVHDDDWHELNVDDLLDAIRGKHIERQCATCQQGPPAD